RQLLDGQLLVAHLKGAPRRTGGGDQSDLAPHILPGGQQLAHDGADRAGRAHHRQARQIPLAHLCYLPVPAYTTASWSPPSSNASCTARTAASRSVSRHTTDTRISDVEIISMLTPASARAAKNLAATPGWDLIPAPMSDTLPTWSSNSSPLN